MRLALLSVAALLASGADLTGIWTGQAPGRNGETEDVTFQFRQDGDALHGKLYTETGDIPIVDGKIEGDYIRFSVVIRSGSNATTFLYTGACRGNEIRVTRERVRPGDKASPPQTFTLKRMI
ncbi:MAG TPA: hypothetical protein VFA28_17160 [Bryobacteraceae bacterium]|jgi:hypothetical protein|nr:hypothetical protein [Bryobacteraceae bacterium]